MVLCVTHALAFPTNNQTMKINLDLLVVRKMIMIDPKLLLIFVILKLHKIRIGLWVLLFLKIEAIFALEYSRRMEEPGRLSSESIPSNSNGLPLDHNKCQSSSNEW